MSSLATEALLFRHARAANVTSVTATTAINKAKTNFAERRRDKAERSNRASIDFPLIDTPCGSRNAGDAPALLLKH